MDLTLNVTGLCGLILQGLKSTVGHTRNYERALSVMLSGMTSINQSMHMGDHTRTPERHHPRLCVPPVFVESPFQADHLIVMQTPQGRVEVAVWDLDSFDVSLVDSSLNGDVTAHFRPVDPANPDFQSLEFVAQTRRASEEARQAVVNPAVFSSDPDPALIAARMTLERGLITCVTPKNKHQLFVLQNYKDQQFVETIEIAIPALTQGLVHLQGFGPKRGQHRFIRLREDPITRKQPTATVCNLPNEVPASSQPSDPVRHFVQYYDIYLPPIPSDKQSRPLPTPATHVDPVFCLMAGLAEV